VLLTHAGFLSGATGRSVLPGFLARMDIGVAVFFVLSGFLLYTPHARANTGVGSRQRLGVFGARRAARLVPAWLCVLAATPLLVAESRDAPVSAWVANLAQLQSVNYAWIIPGLAQLWSLSTEVMFYIALPFVGLFVGRVSAGRRPWVEPATLAALGLGAWAFRAATHADLLPAGYTWHQTLPATFDWFVWGMLLAVVAARETWISAVRRVLAGSANALLVVAASIFWVLTTRIAGPYDLAVPSASEDLVKHIGYGLVALLVVAPSVLGTHTVASRLLRTEPMQYLGRISYAVFLWHMPVMFAVRALLGLEVFSGFWLTLVATAVVTLPIAMASWHFIEQPVQRRVRSYTSAPRSPVDAARR
jgi:peptidoglycan/LPS O-acetylase OafA/YrhL